MAIVDASVVVDFIAPDADTVDALFDCWVQTGEERHAPAMTAHNWWAGQGRSDADRLRFTVTLQERQIELVS